MRALAVVLASLTAIGSQADAEVWPVSTRALCAGPFAALEPRAFDVWSNPALAALGPSPRAGIASLEPYGVSDLARVDLALSARSGPWGGSAGWSRFGRGAIASDAWAAGVAASTAEGGLALGAAVRRHARETRTAWALDTGVRAEPVTHLVAAAVARSVGRAGDQSVSPDPEWEIDVGWMWGAGALAASLVRDQSGPVSGALASELAAGPIRIYSRLERVAGGETRVGLGIETRIAFGLRAFLARDEGPVLPESRSAGIEWAAGQDARSADSSARSVSKAPVLDDAQAAAGWDSLATLDAMEDELVADPEVPIADGDPVQMPPQEESSPPAPLRALPALDWKLTVGGRADRRSGLGHAMALGVRSPLSNPWRFGLAFAASRDPGETALWDERRVSASAENGRRIALFVGAFDPASEPLSSGGFPSAGAKPAARGERAPAAALSGAAATWQASRALTALAFLGRAGRDARPVLGGAWPITGRMHRTALEKSRRGAIEETECGLALSGIGSTHNWFAGWTRATYGGVSPRRFPDGVGRREGDWFSLAWRVPRASLETALGPGAGWGVDARLRLRAKAHRPSASVAWQRRSLGFSHPQAVPLVEPLESLEARLESRRLWLAARSQRRWQSPDAEAPVGFVWDRWLGAGARVAGGGRELAIELAPRESWRDDPTPAGLVDRATSWSLRARARWRPPRSACELGLMLGVRSVGGDAAESWQIAMRSSRADALDWSVSADVLPGRLGAAGAPGAPVAQAIPDPLSGLRWEARTSPARLSARLGVPVGAFGISRAEVEGRYATPSGKPRLELWLSVRGGRISRP